MRLDIVGGSHCTADVEWDPKSLAMRNTMIATIPALAFDHGSLLRMMLEFAMSFRQNGHQASTVNPDQHSVQMPNCHSQMYSSKSHSYMYRCPQV